MLEAKENFPMPLSCCFGCGKPIFDRSVGKVRRGRGMGVKCQSGFITCNVKVDCSKDYP